MPVAQDTARGRVYLCAVLQGSAQSITHLGGQNEGYVLWNVGLRRPWLVQEFASITRALQRGYRERNERLEHPHHKAWHGLWRLHCTNDKVVHGLPLCLLNKIVAQYQT